MEGFLGGKLDFLLPVSFSIALDLSPCLTFVMLIGYNVRPPPPCGLYCRVYNPGSSCLIPLYLRNCSVPRRDIPINSSTCLPQRLQRENTSRRYVNCHPIHKTALQPQ